jgi:hypothetical protein
MSNETGVRRCSPPHVPPPSCEYTCTGVWLTLIGSDQVRPPSVDFERPISSRAPPLNRESHQAT